MQNVLNEKITLVSLNISIFCGYRKATPENVLALGGKLPQTDAITEGSIKVFPCEATKLLCAVRRSLFRKLQSRGVGALGSQNVFAIPTSEIEEVERDILRARHVFEKEVANLGANYDRLFDEYIASQAPEVQKIICTLKIPSVIAMSKCNFSTDMFRISPSVREGQDEQEGIEGIIKGLGRRLYEDLAASMQKLQKNEAVKLRKVGQKTIRPIRNEVEKLKKLSFLDSSVDGAISFITEALELLPNSGYIIGQHFVVLERLIQETADADNLLNAASRVKNGVPTWDVLFPPAQSNLTVPEVVEPVCQAEAVVEVLPPRQSTGSANLGVFGNKKRLVF